MDLTADQIKQLQSLGINIPSPDSPLQNTPSNPIQNQSKDIKIHHKIVKKTRKIGQSPKTLVPSTQKPSLPSRSPAFVPLLSISGLTLISLSGLILLKNSNQTADSSTPATFSPESTLQEQDSNFPSPTQVPKSIQHYLLTSQQYFTQAVQAQTASAAPESPTDVVALLNQSIVAASEAITNFPGDPRGYQQRGQIYQSLLNSKPELASQAITDFSTSFSIQPSAEVARNLATIYAGQGNAPKTIEYLSQTVILEPTKAQNFYDLAKIQTQAGQVSQALTTYSQLLTLVSDPNQKTQIESEKQSLQALLSQNNSPTSNSTLPSPSTSTCTGESCARPSIKLDSPLLQADSGQGLIIAAPETSKNIQVDNLTDSNALAGSTTLPSGQKDISISNTNVTSASQIYLSLTQGGKNQTLKLISKSQGSFVAGFDSPLSEDVQFKWWIINQ